MNSIIHKLAAVGAAAAFSLVMLSVDAAPAQADNVTALCNQKPGDKDGSASGHVTGQGVNLRSGPSTSCKSNGQAYPNHKLDYHCYKTSGGYDWTYLRDATTGKKGWVRQDYLSDTGSFVKC